MRLRNIFIFGWEWNYYFSSQGSWRWRYRLRRNISKHLTQAHNPEFPPPWRSEISIPVQCSLVGDWLAWHQIHDAFWYFLLASVAQAFPLYSTRVQGPWDNDRNGIRMIWSLLVSICLRDTRGNAIKEISAKISDFTDNEILTTRKQRRRDVHHITGCV
jgi:hypothetical protein